MKIELPNYHWFVSRHEGRFVTNIYSGSAGTLGDVGCIGTRTFNYRVYVDISSGNESEFRLIVESYIIQPWHLGGHKTDFEKTEFLCSEDCVVQATKWLSEISAKYGF
jgi:hypothetical protein